MCEWARIPVMPTRFVCTEGHMLKTDHSAVAERIEQLAGPVVASMGLELVEVDYRGGFLRLIIDKAGGVGHEDCEAVSRVVGTQLDVEELIDQSYTLEVSSPGLDRRLKRPEEYEKYRGRLARIKAGGQVLIGRLEGVEGGAVLVQLERGEARRVPLPEIQETRLVVDFGRERRAT